MSNSIIACGQEADIGCPVIKWNDPGGLSFYSTKKYTARNVGIDTLRKEVKCFILHHSVTYTAKHTYIGLMSRGLSVNFIIDDNIDKNGYATIYQCLDIKDAGWSHAPLNGRGPAVEICYQPLASTMAQAYSETNQKKYGVQPHQIKDDLIHGQKFRTFCPTAAQVKSTTALLGGFVKLFPDVPPVFPRDSSGKVIKTVIPNPESYTGLLAHFNITRNKIDPLGFPFDQVEGELSGVPEEYLSKAE